MQIYDSKENKNDPDIFSSSTEDIMRRAKKLKIPGYYFGNQGELTAVLSCIYGIDKNYDANKLINNKVFFYIPWRFLLTTFLANNEVVEYSLNREEKIREMLGTELTTNWIKSEILAKDKLNVDDETPQNLVRLNLLFRYEKLKRLQAFYNLLTEFSLSILHLFFWEDFINKKRNGLPLDELLIKLMPSIIQVKNVFEKIVHEGFPINKISKQVQNV